METVLEIADMCLAHYKGVTSMWHPPAAFRLAVVAFIILLVQLILFVAEVSCSLCLGRVGVMNSVGLMDVQRKNVQRLLVLAAAEPMQMDRYRKSCWTLVDLCWVAAQQVCA